MAVIHLLAITAVLLVVRQLPFVALAIPAILFHWCRVRGRYLLLVDAASVHRLEVDDNGWKVVFCDGRESMVMPGRGTVLAGRLMLLHLRVIESGRWLRVPLFSDSSDPDSLRRLRVRLRFGRSGSQSTQS